MTYDATQDALSEEMDNIIPVEYVNIDGYHLFKSAHKLTNGLCAGHADLKTAFDEVAYQAKYLLKHNHGIDCDIEPLISFEEFEEFVQDYLLNKSEDLPSKFSDAVYIPPTAQVKFLSNAHAA